MLEGENQAQNRPGNIVVCSPLKIKKQDVFSISMKAAELITQLFSSLKDCEQTCPNLFPSSSLSQVLSSPLFLSSLTLFTVKHSCAQHSYSRVTSLRRQIPSTIRVYFKRRLFQTTFCSQCSHVRHNFDSSSAFGQSLFLLSPYL